MSMKGKTAGRGLREGSKALLLTPCMTGSLQMQDWKPLHRRTMGARGPWVVHFETACELSISLQRYQDPSPLVKMCSCSCPFAHCDSRARW